MPHKDHAPSLDQKTRLHEKLKFLLAGQFAIGADVEVLGQVLIPGKNRATAILKPDCLPQAAYELGPEILSLLDISTRSRAAMTGAVVTEFLSRNNGHLIDTFEPGDWEKLRSGQSVSIPVSVRNNTQRLIVVEKPTRLFRLYSPIAATPLVGDALRQAIGAGDIRIDGQEGRDWRYLPDDPRTGTCPGIAVTLNPERFWLPPDPLHPEVSLEGEMPLADFRRYIDSLLAPIPPNARDIYWIGETAPVELSPGHYSILGNKLPNGSRHMKSLLLDPGRPWSRDMGKRSGIRVEIRGDPKDVKNVLFFFWSNSDNLANPPPLQ